MTPTNELRFVERTIKRDLMDGERVLIKDSVITGRVLQQKWALPTSTSNTLGPQFVWRDVPCVKEEA